PARLPRGRRGTDNALTAPWVGKNLGRGSARGTGRWGVGLAVAGSSCPWDRKTSFDTILTHGRYPAQAKSADVTSSEGRPPPAEAMQAEPLFAALDRELWLLTAAAPPRRGGLVATMVSQASLSPETPRVLVGVAKQHHTWGLVEASG